MCKENFLSVTAIVHPVELMVDLQSNKNNFSLQLNKKQVIKILFINFNNPASLTTDNKNLYYPSKPLKGIVKMIIYNYRYLVKYNQWILIPVMYGWIKKNLY